MALVAIFLSYSFFTKAQSPYFISDQSIGVKNISLDSLTRAWSGGFRSPMFSEIDANGDGAMDVFVFDRFDKSISIFLYQNNEYVFAPDFDYYFPPLTGWALLRDYNCDGKNDIFSASFSGVQVWENISTGATPVFTQVTNYLTGADGPVTVLSGDVPAIDDIDNDGDMDILTFGQASMYVTYYRNDSACGLGYSVYTQCWGHFSESGLSSQITLGDSCGGNKPNPSPIPTPQYTLHQGSTVSTFDSDGDGDKDLLIGDISSNDLALLTNGGTQNDALVTNVLDKYPAINPTDIYVYTTAYFIDTDHDGDDDLITSTAEVALSGGRNYNNTWEYENTSSTLIPKYELRKENFLSDKAIEMGGGPTPHFYDFDHDGDEDLLIGSFIEKIDPFNLKSSLYLYENIGDSSRSEFQLIDSNFAGLSDTLFYGLNPTTGDLDGDGDIDLIIGNNDGNLIYYENLSNPGVYPSFAAPVYNFHGIDIGFSSAPVLVDLDRDNDLDLIIGEGNGNLNYFENIGDASSPVFNVVTDSLGQVNMQNSQFSSGYGYSTPYITHLDSNNNYDLVVGSWDGLIRIYLNIEDYGLEDDYPFVTNAYFNSQSQNYSDIQFSTRTVPALSDLNGDGLNDMVLGIFRGGVHLLMNNSDITLTPDNIFSDLEQGDVSIYPNPSNGIFTIQTKVSSLKNITVFNSLGSIIYTEIYDSNNPERTLNISHLNNGMYVVKITTSSGLIDYKNIVVE